jgi:hypothetical protein
VKATLKQLFLFGVSVFLGALVWLLSEPITGHREPWDAHSPYYRCALLAAGFIPACFSARRFWVWAIGAWLGQAIAFFSLVLSVPGPNFWPLGILLLSRDALLSLAGAAIGAGVHYLIFRRGYQSTNVV